MRLTHLVLESFRSYPAAELHLEPGLTIVAGPNGAGKTNLLEAIFVAITGHSHRAGSDHELVHHGASFSRVRLDLASDAGEPARIELLIPGASPPIGVRKRLLLNGVPRRASSLSDAARAVLFRPEEMLLLVGSPGERRRFLDGILAQRDRRLARDLVELSRVLAQRNALLRAIRREEATTEGLGFWDEQLVRAGASVMAARLALVAELEERIAPLHAAVAPAEDAGGELRLAYVDSLKDAWPERGSAATADELGEAFRRRLTEVRQKELWNGVSLVGPQRDDLRVFLGGRDVAEHASRGQQRTIILALKLAETELLGGDGAPRPIVLLDDVFSELDPERSERSLALLLERGQVLVTMADLGAIPMARRRGVPVWQVDDGRLSLTPRVA
ncbi:MAG TPA: DNA replication/repair protein RecF [Candidatus Limnocylindria bacterium]|nr:DNA replication/repair protein RecF [Candidatus Limnocylindria bacterium]